MKRILFLLGFLFTVLSANAQFRMVGNASWTTVNDSTYSATVTFQSDLTGQGYLANQITTDMYLLAPTEELYRIDAVSNLTFSSADLTIVEFSNDYVTSDGVPLGQVMVFDFTDKGEIPQAPFGSTGSTAQMQAAVDAYNAKVLQEFDAGNLEPDFYYYSSNVGGDDYSLPLDTLNKYNYITISLEVATGDDNLVTLPDIPNVGDDYNGKVIVLHVSAKGATPGQAIVSGTGDSNIRLTYCTSNGTVIQPDTITLNGTTETDYFAVYRTNEADDYYRQCEQSIVGPDSNYVTPGDTISFEQATFDLTYETLTVGGATLDIGYWGGSVTFTNPSAGEYTITTVDGADIDFATITGDNTTLNASQEMIITVDNAVNSAPRRFSLQLYDSNNDALVDQQATATNHTQTVNTNSVEFTVPGLNGFGASGYQIDIR